MIVKIWPIHASSSGGTRKPGGLQGIKNASDYIQGEQKVTVSNEKLDDISAFAGVFSDENDRLQAVKQLSRVVEYTADSDKTKVKYITKYRCSSDDIALEFQTTAEMLSLKSDGKAKVNTGIVAFHMVQSFPEGLDISDEEVHQCGVELLLKLKKHQGIICSHVHPVIDEEGEVHGKCKHNHILFNAFMCPEHYDPKKGGPRKYHDCTDTYRQLQVYNDEIAIAHGLPIIRDQDMERAYSWKEIDSINRGTSWKERMRMDLDMARRASKNWDDFAKALTFQEYSIDEKKHVTYTSPDGKKARGSSLGNRFTRQSLELYWAERDHAMQRIKRDIGENGHLILSDFVYHYGEPLFAKIPIGPQFVEDQQFYLLPLSNETKADKEAMCSYFNMAERYDICDAEGHIVNAAAGLELLRCIEDLRDETLMAWREQVRLQEKEKDEANRRCAEEEEEKRRRRETYENKRFLNSRTGNPYYVGIYDEDGRRRTMIELIYILALVILDKEEYLWIIVDVPEDQKDEVFYASPNWKIQMLIDSIELSRKEGLDTPADLDKRLDIVGADLSRTRGMLKAAIHVKESMNPLAAVVADYKKTKKLAETILAMEHSGEKVDLLKQHSDVLTQYKSAKKMMYRYRLMNEAAIIDFDKRYYQTNRDVERLKKEEKELRGHYSRLKKLEYSLQLAEDPKYIYGPRYPGEGYTFYRKKEEEEAPRKLWDKIVDAEIRAGAAYAASGAEREKGDAR